MLFRRLNIIERDLEYDIRIKNINKNKIKFADIQNKSPQIIFNNIDIKNYYNIKKIDENIDLNLKSMENYKNTKLFDDAIKEAKLIKTNLILNFEMKKIKLKEKLNIIKMETIKKHSKTINMNINVKIKTGKINNQIIKNPLKNIENKFNKEIIKKTLLELIKEENLNPKNLKFIGFYIDVPVGTNIKYYWIKNQLAVLIDSKVKYYSEAIGFYDSKNNEKYLKLIGG
ncbi:MAG: hypothetical protein PWP28_1146 [Oceanotoga sp.]|uniref:hypothetical protein n=1 Tax=Oceanotoga sp. TaxID=2108366 RepID=UPI00264BA6FE|nr:hypothetical protein [Oceanotoga sp.]MDN5342271.1 hypothetical protein [Oceanotoga sp.]